jgi:hypothetical protein
MEPRTNKPLNEVLAETTDAVYPTEPPIVTVLLVRLSWLMPTDKLDSSWVRPS